MVEDLIKKIPEQFQVEVEVKNKEKLGDTSHIIAGGMGGSHLAPDLASTILSDSNIFVHKNYGLPKLDEDILKRSLFVAISHSGNTEETLDFAKNVSDKGYRLSVISTGGKLLEFAKENELPYVEVPDPGLPPRMSTGFMLVSFLSLIGKTDAVRKLNEVSGEINSKEFEDAGKKISDFIENDTPLIYSSERNAPLAYYMKILLNESSKIPAFSNSFPELNHNAMASFPDSGKIDDFKFILVRDMSDDSHIKKRMDAFEESIGNEGGEIYSLSSFFDENPYKETLKFMMISNWLSFYMAEKRGVDMLDTSFIEDFKKKLG